MTHPPDYLEGKVSPPADDGPATLLLDGQWCGHGEPVFNVYDIRSGDERTLLLQLPVLGDKAMNPLVVMVKSDSGPAFAVYDARQHPASIYHSTDGLAGEPQLESFFRCANCGGERFQVSVGFEVPGDSESPNDTSWFVLAVRCTNCQWTGIIYEDETA